MRPVKNRLGPIAHQAGRNYPLWPVPPPPQAKTARLLTCRTSARRFLCKLLHASGSRCGPGAGVARALIGVTRLMIVQTLIKTCAAMRAAAGKISALGSNACCVPLVGFLGLFLKDTLSKNSPLPCSGNPEKYNESLEASDEFLLDQSKKLECRPFSLRIAMLGDLAAAGVAQLLSAKDTKTLGPRVPQWVMQILEPPRWLSLWRDRRTFVPPNATNQPLASMDVFSRVGDLGKPLPLCFFLLANRCSHHMSSPRTSRKLGNP